MPRQIHVTVTEDQQKRCWEIAQARPEPTTWQEVARDALDLGLETIGTHGRLSRPRKTIDRAPTPSQGDKP
jgi:hypothetical protein